MTPTKGNTADALFDLLQCALIFILGPLDVQVVYLAGLFVADMIVGVMLALRNREFSMSYFTAKTIEKLLIYFILLFVGHATDIVVHPPASIRSVAILILFGREVSSVCDKAGSLGYKTIVDVLVSYIQPLLKGKNSREATKK